MLSMTMSRDRSDFWEGRPGYEDILGMKQATLSRKLTALDRADVRFVRPNIQIYDAHVVDLYQWVCAQYLVGVKGAETKAKRS